MSSMSFCVWCVILIASISSNYIKDCTAAASPVGTEDDAYDQAEGEDGADADSNTLSWVHHAKTGDVIISKPSDIEDLLQYIRVHSVLDDGSASFVSSPPKEMEDGPKLSVTGNSEIDDADEEDRSTSEDTTDPASCFTEVETINYYPEYAIGLLDNGCTAFLVGPYHAMTSAHCIYKVEERYWEENIDFWRGRHNGGYLQKMEWESVLVPKQYHMHGDQSYNWAIITFEKSLPSKVWLSFVFSPRPVGAYVTKYSYRNSLTGNLQMVSKICEGNQDDLGNTKLLNLVCCSSEQPEDGGPVLKGYNFDRYKIPPIVGISGRDKFGEEYSMAYDFDMFWSTCYLLGISGFDPQCSKGSL